MSANRGTPFDALFEALTEKMAVMHTATPDTDPSQRDRVEWKNAGVALAQRGYRKQGADFVGHVAVKYQVSIYGATELEVVSRYADLIGWLDYLVGPEQGAADAGDGYDVKPSGPVQGGNGEAAGFGCVVPVTLYAPLVYSKIWGRRMVASVTIRVTALNSTTDAPTGDSLNPITVAA